MPERTPAAPRKGGLLVVVALAAIFFALIALLVFFGGKKSASPAPVADLWATSTSVRIRTEPRSGAPVVATIGKGDRVEQLDDAGTWVKVRTASGIAGWAERNLLAAAAEHDRKIARVKSITSLPSLDGVAEERTPLYDGPGVYYPVVGELAAGSRVRVFTRDHDFYAIAWGGGIAYAAVDAVDINAGSAPQINVAAEALSATDTTSTTASLAPPEPEPPSSSEPSVFPDQIGVYQAVPPGGTEPQLVEHVQPIYPRVARDAAAEGAVIIRAIIRKDGAVDQVEIFRDLPWGLGEAAKNAVEQWHFIPATLHGDPIDVYYTVTVNFRLRPR
jgi:TonB family protein